MNASRKAKRAGHVASKSSSAMADSDAVSIAPVEDDLGLPGWINDLLKPGVGQGVFVTLKVSLVLLVLTLGSLLIYIEDAVTESTLPAYIYPCAQAMRAHSVHCRARRQSDTRLVRLAADCAPAHENLSLHGVCAADARRMVHR